MSAARSTGRDGTPADLTKVRQTDLFVVVIKGNAHRRGARRRGRWSSICCRPGSRSRRAIAGGGPIAGGLCLAQGARPTPPIPRQRDDRYVAALDLTTGVKDFTLAYVVRAVTPGEFNYPALVVEDMYEPETTGRTAIGKLVGSRRSENSAKARR